MFLARIIHQPEEMVEKDDFVIPMKDKATVQQAHDALKTISSDHPDTLHMGLMDATGRNDILSAPWSLSQLLGT